MKIGIGIDTGGTCTDAVIYNFEERKVLAFSKTNTTKEDLSVGIGEALSMLPTDLLGETEVIALSTTLATNACVENKGGRAKLVFFGINPDNVRQTGQNYGLTIDESLIFIDSKTKPSGKVVLEPDWNLFQTDEMQKFDECDAVGVVEMFAQKSGAGMEKRARDMIKSKFHIPVVCGHQLFTENNIVKRGASTMLNAKLISIIREFTNAVDKALKKLDIKAPFVIVRSDGSLMTDKFAQVHPIETLLCGPVASVMGAIELSDENNAVIVDMGGTTTDIAFVKNGVPQRVESGVNIGQWKTFVKGLFVDTFGLGGDSGITVTGERQLHLGEEKVMPFCMAASRYPSVLERLERASRDRSTVINERDEIYVTVKNIAESSNYTAEEKQIAEVIYERPLSIIEMSKELDCNVMKHHIFRLIREGVIIRCGITPTDVMHLKGDFTVYETLGSKYGIMIMARQLHKSIEEVEEGIYDLVKEKLYYNIVRILIEDEYSELGNQGIDEQVKLIIKECYKRAKEGKKTGFLNMNISSDATLIGVGAPTHIFLEDVGKLLGMKVVISEFSKVANALGAIVGNVCAKATMEVTFNQKTNSYIVFGGGQRSETSDLEEAKAIAREAAKEKAKKDAIERGAESKVDIDISEHEDVVQTDFGDMYLGYKVVATAAGKLDIKALEK